MPGSSDLADLKIRINGVDLPQKAQTDVAAVSVQEDLDAASMFTIELHNWDMEQLKFTWSDDKLFAPGNEVEIWLGYVDALKKVMVGEITSLEPLFSAQELPVVMVRGYDHRHRLQRGRQTRSFIKMKDSAIAQQIASTAGLGARVKDSKVTLDYVVQHNQTNLAFLQERARRLGYEVFVKEKILYFQPQQNTGQAALTLSLDQDLLEFSPRLTTMDQVGEVVVRGWDIKQKKVVVGKAGTGQEATTMGGAKSGPKAANQAFGKSSAAIVNRPVFSKAEADQIALGQFNRVALTYIQGDGVCQGRTELRAGTVVKIEGVGQRFSGLYYVTSATHTLQAEQGYQTAFTVERNAT